MKGHKFDAKMTGECFKQIRFRFRYHVDIAWIAMKNFHELLLFLFLVVLSLLQSKPLSSGDSILYLQEPAVGSGQMGSMELEDGETF